MEINGDGSGMFLPSPGESGELIARYEAIVNAIDDGLYQLDADGRFVAVNDRIVERLEIGRNDLIGNHVSVVLDGATIERFEESIAEGLATDESVITIVADMETAAGKTVPFEFRVTPLLDDGEFVGTVGVARDITERVEHERRLEAQRDAVESELEETMGRISDGFFALDEEYCFTHVNERAEAVFDLDESDVLDESIWDVLPEGVDEEEFRDPLETAMATQSSVEYEGYYPPLDIWIEATAYPSETGVSVYVRDVTDRIERERELELYESTVETIWDGVATLDPDDRIVMVNSAVCEMTGFDREELVGEPITKLHSKSVNAKARGQIREMLAGEREMGQLQFELHTADGETIPVEGRFGPYEYADGQIGKTGVMRDITDRRAIQRERAQRRRQQRVIAELGELGLQTRAEDLDAFLDQIGRQVAETLDTPLCEILELQDDGAALLLRAGTGWKDGAVGNVTVPTDERSQAGYTLLTEEPIVTTDLAEEARFSGPSLLTDHDATSGITVIIGSVEEPWGILGTHHTERFAFSQTDVQFVQSVANILGEVLERVAYEIELKRYERTLETVWDGVTTLDADERFVMVNEAFCEMTGYDREEVIGSPASLIINESDHAAAAQLHDAVEAGELDVAILEYDLQAADGGTIPVEARFGPVEFEDGTTGGTGVIRDVTVQKARERALEEYETIVETINDGVYVLDEDYRFVLVNDAYVEMTGRSREDLLGAHCSLVVGEEVSEKAAERPLEMAHEDDGHATIEAPIIRPDGSQLPGESRFTALTNDAGEYRETVGVVRDLSERRAREREAREARRRMELALDVTGATVWEYDVEADAVTTHPDPHGLFGISLESGEDFLSLIHPDDRDRIAEALRDTIAHGTTYHEEFRIVDDGEIMWVADYGELVERNEAGDRTLIGATREITARKERERELQRTREWMEFALDATDSVVWTWDVDADEVEFYPDEEALYGRSVDTFEEFRAVIHPDDRDDVEAALRRSLETGDPKYEEVKFLRDGEVRWLEAPGKPVEETDGTTRMIGIARDVTDRKKRDLEFERTFDLLNHTEQIADVGGWEIDPETKEVFWSDQIFRLLGFEEGDEPPLEDALDLYHDDDRETVDSAIETALTDGEDFELEARLYSREGQLRWLHIRGIPRIEDGEVVALRGAAQDITDRKRRERALEENERRYRTLAENFPNGAVALFDEEFRYLTAGGALMEQLGIDPTDVEGESIYERYPDDLVARIEPHFEAVFDGEQRTFEERYYDRDLSAHTLPVRNGDGEIFAGMLMVQDVTERREHERFLEEAKAQMEAATEAGAVGTYEWDIQADRLVAGSTLAKKFGVDPADARAGVPLEEFTASIHAADRDRVMERLSSAIESGRPFEEEYRVYDGDDELRWVIARGEVRTDEAGDPSTFPGTLMDITSRKQAELALEEHRRQLETLFGVLPVGVIVAEPGGEIVDYNDRAAEIWGGDVFNIEATDEYDYPWSDVRCGETGEPIEPDDRPMPRVLEGEKIADPVILEFEPPDATHRVVSVYGMPIRDPQGDVIRGVVVHADVTDRVERERELTALNRLNEAVRAISHAAADSTSRESIEARACEIAIEPDPYITAWICPTGRGGLAAEPRAIAGDDHGLVDTLQSPEGSHPEPIVTAVESGELAIVEDVTEEPSWEAASAAVAASGVRSAIAVPIHHDDIPYGVLTICTDGTDTFGDAHGGMFTQLGEIIGHAFHALDRRQALIGDSITEVELLLQIEEEPFTELTAEGGSIVFDRTVPTGDETVLHFVTVAGIEDEAFREAARVHDIVDEVRLLAEEDDRSIYELTTSGSRLVETLTRYSGQIRRLTIEDGHDSLIADFPHDADIRSLLEALERLFDGVDLRAQRTRAREGTTLEAYRAVLGDRLTDRQRVALETAYFAGYFDWPRTSTGEEVAALLDLSSATFTQHLRTAERKIFDELFAESPA